MSEDQYVKKILKYLETAFKFLVTMFRTLLFQI